MTFTRFKKKVKFKNEKSLCALNHSHASKLEGAVCQILQLREKAGELKILQVQDHVRLTLAEILYVPDFKCEDLSTGETIYVESKGYSDQKWPIKKKLWKFYGPAKLEIWIGDYRNPRLDEIIEPKKKEE